ncbi:hypothetical protein [Serinicoccus sediminis]|uniref:hypothetical protein n=1 Tax=Serinicoccus sediminis TaxID=2306021 RepID=UPI00102218CB|nr:hypothetical protein [Serinicoccus sediminis]
MDMTSCPECGAVAEVQWRDVLESTDGPVEHAKVLCLQRHWFLLPVAWLVRPAAPPGRDASRLSDGPVRSRRGSR